MKKIVKLSLLVALAMMAVNVSAQLPTGLGFKVGYVNAKAKFTRDGVSRWSAPQNGVKVGAFYDLNLLDKTLGLSLRPGVNYIYTGGKSEFRAVRDLGYKDRSHTLSIPVDLKFFWNPGSFKLYLFAGPKFNVGLVYNLTDGTTTAEAYTGKTKSGGQTVQDPALLNRFNLAIGGGLGAEFKGAFLEIGYDWELLNEVKDKSFGRKLHRGFLGLDVGYHF
jgi:hypothetical protein